MLLLYGFVISPLRTLLRIPTWLRSPDLSPGRDDGGLLFRYRGGLKCTSRPAIAALASCALPSALPSSGDDGSMRSTI